MGLGKGIIDALIMKPKKEKNKDTPMSNICINIPKDLKQKFKTACVKKEIEMTEVLMDTIHDIINKA